MAVRSISASLRQRAPRASAVRGPPTVRAFPSVTDRPVPIDVQRAEIDQLM
jgi:hypothetical protein